MKQSIQRAAWFASGLVVLVAAVELTRNASGQSAVVPMAVGSVWPPLAADIVNLTGQFSASTAGQTADLYTVPSNRWLVITDLRSVHLLGVNNATGVELVEVAASGVATVRLDYVLSCELFSGQASGSQPAAQRPIVPGIAFQPGSKVQLRVASTYSPIGPINFHYAISGYLSR